MSGLLGNGPSRNFKIFRTDFPAIFRFNGKLYIEHYDMDTMRDSWVEIDERDAVRWTEAKAPDLQTTAEAATTPTPSQVQDGNAEETVEDIMTRTRRHYWEGRWDQGWKGHAFGGTKKEWVDNKLAQEGYL